MSIYLDNAATSFPKPDEVYRAVEHALRNIGVGPGRGGHRRGVEANRLVFEARESIAELFSLSDSSRVIFTHSTTEGLNLALLGTVRSSDHVVTTTMEHNSVVRPLHKLIQLGATVTKVAADAEGFVKPEDIVAALTPKTRLVVMSHCSNVTGTLQPVEEIGALLKKRGVLFLVDAAQTAGVVAIDPVAAGIDLLAAPGHKGLLGPQGTGILYIGEGVEPDPLLTGGTGGFSHGAEQPQVMPERYESGTLNTLGIAGLKEGVDFILRTGTERIRNHEINLAGMLIDGLRRVKGVRIHGPRTMVARLGVVSFTAEGHDPADIGFRLDRDYDISVRVGLHCSPDAHRTIGTLPAGTVRVSPGWFNTEKEITAFLDAVTAILGH